MAEAFAAFPAPDPDLDAAAAVAYVQWLVDYDLDALTPRVLPAFEGAPKAPDEELRGITVTSVVQRARSVQVFFTIEYARCFEVPAHVGTDNPVHVIHGQAVGSNWEFPVLRHEAVDCEPGSAPA